MPQVDWVRPKIQKTIALALTVFSRMRLHNRQPLEGEKLIRDLIIDVGAIEFRTLETLQVLDILVVARLEPLANQSVLDAMDKTLIPNAKNEELKALLVKLREALAAHLGRLGDTVVWINRDPFPQTATAQAGGFDAKSIAPGKSWKCRATKRGVYPYAWSFPSTMRGTLRVE